MRTRHSLAAQRSGQGSHSRRDVHLPSRTPVSNAIDSAKFRSRSHDAVICVLRCCGQRDRNPRAHRRCQSMSSTIPAHVDLRESDTRQGRRLEYFTLGWNLTEAVGGIGAGLIAGSVALVGFGVDSIIESFSGASLLWRLQSHETGERRKQLALKLVGISFSYSQPMSRLMPSRR
jgi:hypothetical protein